MPKPMYVWSGTAWVSVASEVESLATYATQSYADNQPGMKLIVPSSVAVGSGSGSVATQGTVSFSGASSVSINDVFSATYDNYRIVLDITDFTSDANIYIKMRVSGADNSTNYYTMFNGLRSDASSFTNTENNVTNGIYLTTGDAGTDNIYGFVGDILKPFLALPTRIVGINNCSTSTGIPASQSGGGLHSVSTSYTGFTLIASAGNITGTINVYGYKKG